MTVPPLFSLRDRAILVVGATGDVGGAAATLLHETGARLILTGRDPSKLDLLGQARPGAQVLPLDWSSAESRAALVGLLPSLDGVVLAGGKDMLKPLRFVTDSEFEELFAANVSGPVLFLRDLIRARLLAEGASVVLISSVLETRAAVGHSVYAASKGALASFCRSLALELSNRSIRVNLVAAGMLSGAMAGRARQKIGDEAFARHLADYPLGPGNPSDAAAAALFLLSPAARWITGTSLVVDGGYGLA